MVILTEWDEFRALDFDRISMLLEGNVLVDLRNSYTPEDMVKRGFSYTCVGQADSATKQNRVFNKGIF